MSRYLPSDRFVPVQTEAVFSAPPPPPAARITPRRPALSLARLYAQAYNLCERPFTLLPDPDFLYWSAAHQGAYTMMEYGILSGGPITLITGEIGTGKTTLLHHLLRTIDPDVTVGLIANARGGRGDLIRWALHAFGVAHDGGLDHVALFRCLRDFLVAERKAQRPVVIIVDEAQNLSPDAVEELRMLTNLQLGKLPLVQLLLVGQPELRTQVEGPGMQAFVQRVTASYHLTGLDAEGTAAYIAHRMRHAGGTGQEFTPEAIAAIHAAAGGVPRNINKICDLALLYSVADGSNLVCPAIVAGVLAVNPLFAPLH